MKNLPQDKKTWNQTQGQRGEDRACRHLEKQGYAILARRFRSRWGEIDIIALKKDTLAFVEVKSRCQSHFGNPLESITPQKISRLKKAALYFLQSHPAYRRDHQLAFLGLAFEEENQKIPKECHLLL